MAYPFIQAKWFKTVSSRPLDLIVLHSIEDPDKGDSAERTARYFQTLMPSRKASAHYCVDSDSIVQCVLDRNVAFAAPGANHNGIHIEQNGYARQSRAEWLDDSSLATIRNAASLAASLCRQYNIPARFVDYGGVRGGGRGITTHWEVTKAFRESTHTDPGAEYPIDVFINELVARMSPTRQEAHAMADGVAGELIFPHSGIVATRDGGLYPWGGFVPLTDGEGKTNAYQRAGSPIVGIYGDENGYTLREANGGVWRFGAGPQIPSLAGTIKYSA